MPSSDYSPAMFWDKVQKLLKNFQNSKRKFEKYLETFEIFNEIFEKINKNLKNFWKIFKVCCLSWKLVPAFWNFYGFRGGGRSPVPPPWSRYCELLVISFHDFTTLKSKSIVNLQWFVMQSAIGQGLELTMEFSKVHCLELQITANSL